MFEVLCSLVRARELESLSTFSITTAHSTSSIITTVSIMSTGKILSLGVGEAAQCFGV